MAALAGGIGRSMRQVRNVQRGEQYWQGERNKRRILVSVICLVLIAGGMPSLAQGSPAPRPQPYRAYVAQEGLSGDVIVVLEPQAGIQAAEATDIAVEASGQEPTQVFDTVFDGFATNLTAAEVDDLADDPQVQGIFPDRTFTAAAQTLPTGVDRIDADTSPIAKINGVDQRVDADVAVLDSGINPVADLNLIGGKDCSGSDTGDFSDDYSAGHGTHVAGTIGAIDNTSDVVGVAPGVRLWAVKVLSSTGNGLESELICGLNWVAQNAGTIDVGNMSLVGPAFDDDHESCASGDTSPLHLAICNVVNTAGVPLAVAAGNSNENVANWVPATYPEVITVSGINDTDGQPGNDTRYSASNFGDEVDIAAPAVNILSTSRIGGTASKTGTSMAAPHVAGAAALYLSTNPGASPGQVLSWLLANAKPQNSSFGFSGGVSGEPALYVGTYGTAVLTLNPTAWRVGTSPTFNIFGFEPNTSVTVAFVGTTFNSSKTVTTNSGGAASGTIKVPATKHGTYIVRATSATRTAETTFTVLARILIDPTSAARGATIGVSLRGYNKKEVVRIRWKNGNGWSTITTVTVSNSGSANFTIQVPPWAPDGINPIRGDGPINRAETNAFTVTGGPLQAAAATPGTPIASPVAGSPVASPEAASPVASPVDEGQGVAAATEVATESPTETPTEVPTAVPTETPTESPTETPTEIPTETPSPTPEVTPYPVYADASSDSASPAWVVYDEDPQTYWEVAAPAPTPPAEIVEEGTPGAVVEEPVDQGPPDPDAFVVLDLGGWVPIGTVRWLFAVENEADDLTIEVSDDGINWTPITQPGQVGNAPAGEWQELVLPPGAVGGRYVRFGLMNPNADPYLGGFAEIEVLP